MDVVRALMKKPQQADSLAIGLFAASALYTIFNGTASTIIVGIAFTLIVLGCLPKQVALAFLVGASAIVLVQTRGGVEGFADANANANANANVDVSGSSPSPSKTDISGVSNVPVIGPAVVDVSGSSSEGFSAGRPLLPDNADRKEPLVLGKSYTLPHESDDKGFHLDSGTTFLNAYKALKPDQIAAMTRDTQELLATQKSLVAMLDSFAPLMKDMGKITGMMGSFGGGAGGGGN